MPKRIEELANATTDRKGRPRKTKVIMKDGIMVEMTISPLTRERFPSAKRVEREKKSYHTWRQSQDHKRAFNRDQYLASQL